MEHIGNRAFDEIAVGRDLMTPSERLDAIELQEVLHARMGDVIGA